MSEAETCVLLIEAGNANPRQSRDIKDTMRRAAMCLEHLEGRVRAHLYALDTTCPALCFTIFYLTEGFGCSASLTLLFVRVQIHQSSSLSPSTTSTACTIPMLNLLTTNVRPGLSTLPSSTLRQQLSQSTSNATRVIPHPSLTKSERRRTRPNGWNRNKCDSTGCKWQGKL